MTKNELIKIAENNNMDWIVNPITNQKFGVWCVAESEIKELDSIIDSDSKTVNGTREYRPDGTILYRIVCPTAWMDLYGWC